MKTANVGLSKLVVYQKEAETKSILILCFDLKVNIIGVMKVILYEKEVRRNECALLG